MELLYDICKPLIGVVHLPPLPGSPGYKRSQYPRIHGRKWDMGDIIEYAVEEARKYYDAGFDGVILENYGDRPFRITASPGQAISLALVASEVNKAVPIRVGVNVLRNSAYEALYIAYTAKLSMIRVNNMCEVRVSPEGIMEPAAHRLARAAAELDAFDHLSSGRIVVFADVDVKHSTRIGGEYDLRETVSDCIERAGASIGYVVATGSRTGSEPDLELVEVIASAAKPLGSRVAIGSGVSQDNIATYWKIADAFIVGSSVKVGGHAENPVSTEKARNLVRLVHRYRKILPC